MNARRTSTLALQRRKQRLAMDLCKLSELQNVLRGTLLERYLRCGKANCRCAKGKKHGPNWYLTVTLGVGKTRGMRIPKEKVSEVIGSVKAYQRVKDQLDEMSEINHELLRRAR